MDTLASLDLGVFHVYSTGSGEATNGLNQNTAENFAHPQLRDSAQLQAGGVLRDRRFLTKTFPRDSADDGGADVGPWLGALSRPHVAIPIIRNEELILLRAEANLQLDNLAAALDDINFVRVNSGGLPPLRRICRPGGGDKRPALRAALLAAIRMGPPLDRHAAIQSADTPTRQLDRPTG